MIEQKEIQHLADLARLKLDEQEIESVQQKLSSVLDYVQKLEEVQVNDIESGYQVDELENVVRKDELRAIDEEERKIIIDDVPDKQADYLKVKAVFE